MLHALGGVPDERPGRLLAGVGHEAPVAILDAGQRVAHPQVGGQGASHGPEHVVHVVGGEALLHADFQPAVVLVVAIA